MSALQVMIMIILVVAKVVDFGLGGMESWRAAGGGTLRNRLSNRRLEIDNTRSRQVG